MTDDTWEKIPEEIGSTLKDAFLDAKEVPSVRIVYTGLDKGQLLAAARNIDEATKMMLNGWRRDRPFKFDYEIYKQEAEYSHYRAFVKTKNEERR